MTMTFQRIWLRGGSGVRVVVQFGNGDRVLEGFVVTIKDRSGLQWSP